MQSMMVNIGIPLRLFSNLLSSMKTGSRELKVNSITPFSPKLPMIHSQTHQLSYSVIPLFLNRAQWTEDLEGGIYIVYVLCGWRPILSKELTTIEWKACKPNYPFVYVYSCLFCLITLKNRKFYIHTWRGVLLISNCRISCFLSFFFLMR